MKYLFITEEGNGYFCNCCRRESTSEHTMDFESEEELTKYIESYNKDWKTNDSRIIKAYKLAEEDPVFES
jgi:hypothetical protein